VSKRSNQRECGSSIVVGFVFYHSWNLVLRWLGVARELPIVVVGHWEVCIALEKLVEPSSLNFIVIHLGRG
jgi:hypothetical protein